MHRASQTDQIREGAELFAVTCSPCHGPRMQGSESAFDLRKVVQVLRTLRVSKVRTGVARIKYRIEIRKIAQR